MVAVFSFCIFAWLPAAIPVIQKMFVFRLRWACRYAPPCYASLCCTSVSIRVQYILGDLKISPCLALFLRVPLSLSRSLTPSPVSCPSLSPSLPFPLPLPLPLPLHYSLSLLYRCTGPRSDGDGCGIFRAEESDAPHDRGAAPVPHAFLAIFFPGE